VSVGTADVRGVPVRAEGVELIGETPGSGYREPPALVRRSDGQTIQLTKLLYLVLSAVDGRRTYEEIADAVSPAFGRRVSADNVHVLCDSKLRTLGVLQLADGSQPEVKRSKPLLALTFRYVVSDPSVTRRITAPFARLFNPFLVATVLVAFVAVCSWVLLVKGLASATHEAFDRPGLLLIVFALTVVSAGFHEFGHAAAARYGGATPGAMGAGLYLVWPAFYTDVTDSYRLGRGGRVRTDLGGLYFNAIVAVATFGVWWVTGWDVILLMIATQLLQMLRQLTPLVRFDGYFVLADLTGVPDLFHRIKPTLLGLLPSRWNDPASKVLKPWARAVVTAWVLVVVPLLLAALVLMTIALPRVVGTALAGVDRQWQMMGEQVAAGDLLAVLVRLLSVVAIVLPVLGVGYILARVVRQIVAGTWRSTGGRPGRRAVAAVVAAAIIAGVGWAWWPQPGSYRPIQPDERGTLQDAVPGLLVAHTATAGQGGRRGTAQATWPEGSKLPTADSPGLALALVPRTGVVGTAPATPTPLPSTSSPSSSVSTATGSPAPTWVFPFSRPAAPEAGDNQALAVNALDGSTVYDVAFALVWADGDRVLNTNEAYAFASCTGCRTVSVGFQVVLVLGQANVVVPQNLAGTINYNCLECVTYALATQLVVTLSGPLSQQGNADLAALWEEIRAFGESIEGVALSELQSRLTDYERRILDIIRADPSAAPVGDSEAPADEPSASPAGSETGTPIGTGSSTGASGSTESPTSEPTDTGSPSASTSPSPPSPSTSPSAPSASASPSETTSP
jgi:putative peptide zinc metalloprotease protein